MEEAARVALCNSQLDSEETTQALLRTFAWVEPPEEDTCCLISSELSHHNTELQPGTGAQENNDLVIESIPGGMWIYIFVFFTFICLSVSSST